MSSLLSDRLNAGCTCARAGLCWHCQFAAEARALESKLETRTETLRQFADAVVRAPIDCDCMDCYKERREVRGRAEKMMEALGDD